MSSFKIAPEIHVMDTLREFLDTFSVGKGDILLTDRCLYDPYLADKNLECTVIIQDDFGPGEPNSDKVKAIYETAKKTSFKRVVGIGGGTVIDIAKLLCLGDLTRMLDMFQGKIPVRKQHELLILPTTCGTGSEITNISIVAFNDLNIKLGLAQNALYADHAVLVPELLQGLPYRVFLLSSIDAMIHGMESYLSPKANTFTRFFSVDAIRTILKGYMRLAEKGEGEKTALLKEFLIASCYAGIAFSNAGCGTVHAMSYPLSGEYHLPHGEANHECLIEVFKYYYAKNPSGDLADLMALIASILGCEQKDAIEALEKLLDSLIQRRPMASFGMTEEKAAEFAESVEKTQQRLLANIYVPMNVPDMAEIYKKLL